MVAQRIVNMQPRIEAVAWMSDVVTRRLGRSLRRGVIVVGVLATLCAVLVFPGPASAWHRRVVIRERGFPGYAAPWNPFYYPAPPYNYRRLLPPGAPLSYDDPQSGKTYCWSQYSGAYFVCAYASPPPLPDVLLPPTPPGEPARPASGLLMFRLPKDVEASVDGVPIDLSEGHAVQALPPGQYRVVLQVSGTASEHTVILRSHRIVTVTLAGAVATEP